MERMTLQDYKRATFTMIPNLLFQGKYQSLNNNDRVLYGKLLNRWEWSYSQKWVDADGAVYFQYTQQNLEKAICVNRKTIIRSIERLKAAGLLEEIKQGHDPKTGKALPSIYYLGKIEEKPCPKKGQGQSQNHVPKRDKEPCPILSKNHVPKRDNNKTIVYKDYNNNKDYDGDNNNAQSPRGSVVVVPPNPNDSNAPMSQPTNSLLTGSNGAANAYAPKKDTGLGNKKFGSAGNESTDKQTKADFSFPDPVNSEPVSNGVLSCSFGAENGGVEKQQQHSPAAIEREPVTQEERFVVGIIAKNLGVVPEMGLRYLRKYGMAATKASAQYAYDHKAGKKNLAGFFVYCLEHGLEQDLYDPAKADAEEDARLKAEEDAIRQKVLELTGQV